MSKGLPGRPTKYDAEYHPLMAWSYMQQNMTIEECAEKMGFAPATLYNWAKKYPDFKEALSQGAEKTNADVEKSLFKRAVGYSARKLKVEYDADGDVIRKIAEEVQVAPETTAGIFWLKNRNPRKWRDKQDMELTGKDGGPIMTAEARRERIKELEEKRAD